MPRKQKLVLYSSPLALLLVLATWGGYQVQQFERGAKDLADTGTAAIQLLKEAAAGIADGDLDRLMACYSAEYTNPGQAPWRPALRADRDGIRVYDWQRGEPRTMRRADMAAQLERQLDEIGSLDLAKFKLASVEEIVDENDVRIRAILWLRGTRPEVDPARVPKVFETQISFRMQLVREEGDWKIAAQNLIQGETVTGDGSGFTDIAKAAGIDYVAQRNPLFATAEWEPKTFGIIKYGSAGVSATDVDNDGWYDLFFADGQSPRLYRNLGADAEGAVRFRDISAESGLPLDQPGINVGLFADFDNDGDKDLLLGRFMEGNLLLRNDGVDADGVTQFTDVTEQANLGRHFVVVASAADYDNDGDLDLYLGRYLDPRSELPTTLFYTRNSEGNSLLRNDGDLRFTDVTDEAGVREGGLTLGVAWADYDEDGDDDLYVANDFGRNALFRNMGPDASGIVRFDDVSEATGTLDFGFGMSASWGDVDNDLDLDLYVSNVHSGQRWYGQAATLYQYLLTSVRQGTIVEDYPLYREIFGYAGADWRDYGDGMVKGNSLLLNDGEGRFEDVAESSRTNPFGWYWASAFFDYDNDGRQDIYAANGWISGRTYDDL
ncbi:MAG: VCBS repeat-containing protein [Acidobacteriota bacterium]